MQFPPQNTAHAKELQILFLSKKKNLVVSSLRASSWSGMLHPQNISFLVLPMVYQKPQQMGSI